MPSKTPAQARLMAMSCHGKGPVPRKVACEFNRHDAGTGILSGKRTKKPSAYGRRMR